MPTRGSSLNTIRSRSLTCLSNFHLNNSDLVKIMTKRQQARSNCEWNNFCDLHENFDSDARFENLNRTADRIRPKSNLNTVDDWRTDLKTQMVPSTRALLIGFIGSSRTLLLILWWWRCTGQHTRMKVPSRRGLTCNQANGPGLILEKYLINLLS
jgi:hypothetical protein